MSKLTLDEAIKHCLEVAEDNERAIDCLDLWEEEGQEQANMCRECAADHRQLAEWLTELKELRSLKTDYVFFKAEAAKLLKMAVEDFTAIAEVHAAATPILCPQYEKYMKAIDIRTRKWQYADEALKLIEG